MYVCLVYTVSPLGVYFSKLVNTVILKFLHFSAAASPGLVQALTNLETKAQRQV